MDLGGHLRGLFRFSGRERRTTFWLWIAPVFGSTMVIAMIGMGSVLAGTMTRMQRFAAAHPDQATVTRSATNYSIQIQGAHPELAPPFEPMLVGWALITVAVVVLLAAAVSRRLHDSGRSGLWGLMPLPFLFGGYFGMGRILTSFDASDQPDMQSFFLLFANNLLYLVLLGVLIVFCCLPTQQHSNRYGPPPGPRVG